MVGMRADINSPNKGRPKLHSYLRQVLALLCNGSTAWADVTRETCDARRGSGSTLEARDCARGMPRRLATLLYHPSTKTLAHEVKY